MDVPSFLFLALFLLSSNLSFGNVTLSSTFSTNDKNPSWVSPSGDFAFGFRKMNPKDLFLLAVWFDKTPDKTIVWNANSDNLAPIGSKVMLTSTSLTLTDPSGKVLWKQEPMESISYGAMLDTGNFVLVSSGSAYVWQSFNNPTDTLLPNQNMGLNTKLYSRMSETNFSQGRFELYFEDGNLLLSPVAWPTQFRYRNYYISQKYANANDSASQLVFYTSGDVYIENTNGGITHIGWNNKTVLNPSVYYYRATLDVSGVFTQYSHPKGSNGGQGWSILRFIPENICFAISNEMGSGCCGYNSYCAMENQRPTCKCPDGYSLTDPNNQFSGCQPIWSLGCGADKERLRDEPEDLYELKELRNVNWPLGDYERLSPYTQESCKDSCLHDCMCAVAIFSGGNCWKKKLPLSNGRYESSSSQVALIKTRIPKGESPGKKDEGKEKTVLLGSLIGSMVLNSFLSATLVLALLMRSKKNLQDSSTLSEINLHSFSYEALKVTTKEFSEELGRGSFGIVYKGVIDSKPRKVIAVKKLGRLAEGGEKEFMTELNAIGKTWHKNLVGLIGFCEEGPHRLIVYEYMSNGTLASLLFGTQKPSWGLRIRIACGVARGLAYLHEECDVPIIHCDIKPQNILLDEHLTPKISDFGLAKLLLSDQTGTKTMIRGTRGYVAPEWFKNVAVTSKVDVYSFGVMLLEIICCRKSVKIGSDIDGEEEKAILTDWAYDLYAEGRIGVLVEEDEEAMEDKDRVVKWVMIAIWCIQEHAENRPTMKIVMQMLEGSVDVLVPPMPSFTITN